MKRGLTVGLTAAAAAASALVAVGVAAGPLQRDSVRAGDQPQPRTARQLADGVRAAGLDPDGTPELHGRYYVLRALDRRGIEMRVLADAEDGDILSILPARRQPDAYPPSYGGGARIIHVPQSDDAVAEGDERDSEPAARSEPPLVRRIRPALPQHSEAPRIDRYVVTSVPPPRPLPAHGEQQDKPLTPVYPTPNFGANAGGEKFDPPPRDSEAAPPQRLE